MLKPSEVASLSVLRMVALAHEAGLPDGVLNVVTGAGPVSGRALAMSMDVDALAFTGSGSVGRQLMEAAAKSNLKRVFLELGGKSPHIVFDDTADLDTAAEAVVTLALVDRRRGRLQRHQPQALEQALMRLGAGPQTGQSIHGSAPE